MLKLLEYEESIGKLWNNFLEKRTSNSFEISRVFLSNESKLLTIFHHLLGGEKGKSLHVTDKRFIDTSRSILEKISGKGKDFFLTWQDEDAIYLPSSIAYFPTKNDNEMLYFWLIAMSVKVEKYKGSLIYKNFKATQELITLYPGFKIFYENMSNFLIQENKHLSFIKSLNEKNLTNEKRNRLINHYPFIMWIYPSLSHTNKYSDFNDEELPMRESEKPEKPDTLKMKKQANKIDDKKETDGLLAFLPDAMMSILEQINVDRSEDDSFDEDALYNAEDLDEITLGQKKANLSSRLKMDLDLSSSSKEEYPLGSGHFLDEWDYSKDTYLKKYACIKPFLTTNIEAMELPKHLKKIVKRIESELNLMELERIKNNRLTSGDEINLDTWIEYKVDKDRTTHHQKFYENYEKKIRDVSTLILADVSLSTEAGITQEIKIIDMIKDGLLVFSEALEKLHDRFAIYTFSSLKNTNIKFEIIKNFKEKYTDNTKGRIISIKPGYYTRLGAAIRESSKILSKEKTKNRLLLIISDGKPNDVDRYDGRYGIEDTKKAIDEATRLGLTPFCITIDLESKDYLPYLFGKNGYVLIRDSKKLPSVLPNIYMNLTK